MADVIEKIQIGENVHPIDRVYNAFTASSTTGSSASGSVKSVRWYVSGIDGITTPYDGMKVAIKIPRAGIATGGVVFSINGNNAADYHPVAYNINTVFTTQYAVNIVKIFIYDATAKMTCYINAGTGEEITGVWKGEGDYNSTGYLSYTAGAVSSGTTKNYIIGKPTVSSSGTNKYNANVYFEGDGTLNAPELSEGGTALASKYVRVDTNAQVLTDAQKENARTNIEAESKPFIAVKNTDYTLDDYGGILNLSTNLKNAILNKRNILFSGQVTGYFNDIEFKYEERFASEEDYFIIYSCCGTVPTAKAITNLLFNSNANFDNVTSGFYQFYSFVDDIKLNYDTIQVKSWQGYSGNGVQCSTIVNNGLPTFDSSKANYVLSVNSSGDIVWRAPYNGEHSNG